MPPITSVRRALRQAWELDLARRLDQEAPGVAASILEGLDEMCPIIRGRQQMSNR
jgi:putative transposase